MDNNITFKMIDNKYLKTHFDTFFIKNILDMFQKATLDSDYMVKNEILSEEGVIKVFNNENLIHFIVFAGSVPVGYCQIIHRAKSYEFSSNIKINALSIIPEYRKIGLGKKLMQICLDWCTDNNIKLLYLDVVHKNIVAKNLYEKFGFNKTGELLNAYKKDEEHLNLETYSKNF